jgi:acetyl esterase/lipase
MLCGLAAGLVLPPASRAADEPAYTRREDVIYGRKYGTALTMDIFTPKAEPVAMRAVTIPLPGVAAGHVGLIPPKSHVDILFTAKDPGPDGPPDAGRTTTLLQGVEVLAIDREPAREGEAEGRSPRSLTLLVSPDGAARLERAQTQGTLHMALTGVRPDRDDRRPAGLGVILVVSGGWFSAHEAIGLPLVTALVDRGYTVFAVVHGSQPKYTIPEILQDMNRAVRFIRLHARDYGIDPDHIGVTGGSAGGHLSLMLGTAGDAGQPDAPDPVDRQSSRVQAVACFFPPTDFLNYGQPGEDALGRGRLANFQAPFDFHELDRKTNTFVPVTDEAEIRAIGRRISPITHVSADDPPTLILHGDADELVPIQQAEVFLAKLREAGVETKLVIKPGAGHGWPEMVRDVGQIADWFDRHLKPRRTTPVLRELRSR